jgi:C1A family cysteine protease
MVYQIEGFGWLPDPPSSQDLCPESAQVSELIGQQFPGLAGEFQTSSLPERADISQWNSAVKDQTNIGGCVGMGTSGDLEHWIKKNTGQDIVLSARYSYKTTRYLMGEFYEYNDTGAFIRSGFGAAHQHGIAPEQYWPWVNKDNARNAWNDNPHPLSIPLAYNYRVDKYVRLDPTGYLPVETVNKIRATVAKDENTVTFGFTCFPSINNPETRQTGRIRFRQAGEGAPIGGHCVLICGYDDTMVIGGYTGAFKIKNSWGLVWGERGYGWIPYEYILSGNAADCWTSLSVLFKEQKPFRI